MGQTYNENHIEDCLNKAGIGNLIKELPEGLNTIITPASLSTG